jgi:hypothetical protein
MSIADKKEAKKRKDVEIEQRRMKIAANYLAGMDYRDTAAALNVSLGTVAGDMKAILGQWQKHYAADLNKRQALQLKRLDVMLNGIWKKARDGDLAAIDRVLSIMAQESRILGLDKIKLDHTTDGKPMPGITVVNPVLALSDEQVTAAMKLLEHLTAPPAPAIDLPLNTSGAVEGGQV